MATDKESVEIQKIKNVLRNMKKLLRSGRYAVKVNDCFITAADIDIDAMIINFDWTYYMYDPLKESTYYSGYTPIKKLKEQVTIFEIVKYKMEDDGNLVIKKGNK